VDPVGKQTGHEDARLGSPDCGDVLAMSYAVNVTARDDRIQIIKEVGLGMDSASAAHAWQGS
jgi:hypothetical protein